MCDSLQAPQTWSYRTLSGEQVMAARKNVNPTLIQFSPSQTAKYVI